MTTNKCAHFLKMAGNHCKALLCLEVCSVFPHLDWPNMPMKFYFEQKEDDPLERSHGGKSRKGEITELPNQIKLALFISW